ncbi:LLM class flavin-dependent oxidoreductase [Siccirubricoccus sp. KC 17139]|uniref:LLM class flavin-dependent oxidoreductase n=1 Tax=Siccirubricoccus soli TaxID=2899147 RepID=A0ABT1D3T4_9PROT|nr:LLM class flavin-dependent oxidoreductase [Siccirubricoccus soli]MCO6416585.1 LLM class flavin-dependent oxidoreductase [Siccirubricoccus soli]MCP2682720.1 LLM class flavin-dependent oxidoreductase [Siccirubricoccus soli]
MANPQRHGAPRLRYAYQIGAVGEQGSSDRTLYREAIADAQLLQQQGYDAAWMVEHHFSDYYPQPNPLLFLSHIAAACPGLGLGTAVMVLPWYEPTRFAEDLAMLQTLTEGELHIGMGRGTAKSEYDAFGIPMETARDRFRACWETVRRAVETGTLGEGTALRPPFDRRPHFYGAIGSPESAGIMAGLGLPPLCLSSFPDHLLKRILDTWKARTAEAGGATQATFPISIKCFVAETDEAAREQALRYLPDFFALQVRHYQSDHAPWGDIPGYQQFNKMFANLRSLSDPANLGPYLAMNLVGSAETVTRRLRQIAALGFNYFLISNATYGVPRAVRHETIRRFAGEVIPRMSEAASAEAAE